MFLGGYVNSTNAQNLNCLSLSKHLDKEKFDIYTLQVYSGNLGNLNSELPKIHLFNCFKPFFLSKLIGYLWGIWHCDVAYLPKREVNEWTTFWLKLFRKKSFSTVEGVFDTDNLNSAIEAHGSYNRFIKALKSYDKLYSITRHLREYNEAHYNITCEPQTLYLGCEIAIFKNEVARNGTLKRIVYIGRLKKRKGIYDLVEIARLFPEITFSCYGTGEEAENLKVIIAEEQLSNLQLCGVVSHKELATVLETCDLHILPSRSEGFPKVTLETAAAGVPSIVYADYGAQEWITHGKNGFVVDRIEEMITIIKDVKANPDKLNKISTNAIVLAEKFDWRVLVKDWEEIIIQQVKEKY